jgi:hypothetical protein
MILFKILAGIALLLTGRRLFWLFVGLIGFIAGIHLATRFIPGQPEWMILAIALTAGVFGALIALFIQWLAIGLAGFSAGAYIVSSLVNLSGWGTREIGWLLIVAGGILGALLIIILFDWALIILSSLAGAALTTEAVHIDPGAATLLFIALFIVGITVQLFLKMKRW